MNGGRTLFDGPAVPYVAGIAAAGDEYAVIWTESSVRAGATALCASIVNRAGVVRDRIVISDQYASRASIASDGYDWRRAFG